MTSQSVQWTILTSLNAAFWEIELFLRGLNIQYVVFINLCCNALVVHDCLYIGLVTTKPVFGVSDKASFKPVSSATETS